MKEEILAAIIERLASDFIMAKSNEEGISDIVLGLKNADDSAKRENAHSLSLIFKLILDSLPLINQNDIDKKRELISYGINSLREALCIKTEYKDEFLIRIKADFDKILNKESSQIPQEAFCKDLSEFAANVVSTLEDVEQAVLSIENDFQNSEKIAAIFRGFHTLKGEAGLLGIKDFSEAAHLIEDLLDKVRNKEISMRREIITLILESIDLLKDMTGALKSRLGHLPTMDISKFREKVFSVIAGKKNNVLEKTGSGKKIDFTPEIPTLNLVEIDILSGFIGESADHLSGVEEALLSLEKNPSKTEEINKIFRAFHTIKGLAGFLNFKDIETLAHETETVMDLIRRGSLAITPEIIELIFSSLDGMRRLVDLLKEQVSNNGILNSSYYDITNILRGLKEAISGVPLENAESKSPRKKLGEILLNKDIITELELSEALQAQKSKQDKKIGDILVEEGVATQTQIERGLAEQNSSSGSLDETVKISVKKLDDLMNETGELVITGSQLLQNTEILNLSNTKIVNDMGQLGRIIRDLQATAMSMRLVPVRPLFQKLLRLVRDLSRKTGKEIDVVLSGEDTEIDKNIIDLIADPLIHMTRNAVDHGIESPGIRSANKKKECGRIELKAYHKGSNIIIEIKDDGRGLDRDRILNKARERGLVKEGIVPEDKEIFNFIFEAGFSTAEKITDISGRGVGMDVVKKNLTKLRGKIDINTEPGKGAGFTIKLPLTLAIIDGIVLALGRERYIVPLFSIIEFIRPKKEYIYTVEGKGEIIRFHEDLFRIIRLSGYFNIEYKSRNADELIGCIVDSDYGRACILFDELISQQQVVIKNIGDHLKSNKALAGVTILGDGRVGFILDINGIVEMFNN